MRYLLLIIPMIVFCSFSNIYDQELCNNLTQPGVEYCKGDYIDTIRVFEPDPLYDGGFPVDTIIKVPKFKLEGSIIKDVIDTTLKYNYYNAISLEKLVGYNNKFAIGYHSCNKINARLTTGVYLNESKNKLMLIQINSDEFCRFRLSEMADSIIIVFEKRCDIRIDRRGFQFIITSDDIDRIGITPLCEGIDMRKVPEAYKFFKSLFEKRTTNN